MAKLAFTKLGLKVEPLKETKKVEWEVGDSSVIIDVKQYLPIKDKTDFLTYVIDHSIDDETGTFAPIRVQVYFDLAICKWYGQITFTDKQLNEIEKTYDLLKGYGIPELIGSAIPEEELAAIADFCNNTIEDMEKYNQSFVGMIQTISNKNEGMDATITDILDKIKNKEGIETLDVIRDIMGKND